MTDLFRRLFGAGSAGSVSAAAPDGSSMETAVVIDAPNTRAGVAAEYQWIARHLPGSKMQLQELLHANDRSYDRITVADDVAPNSYPGGTGVGRLLPSRAVMAAVRCAEPSVERSAADRRAA